MKQQSLMDGFEKFRKKQFLDKMETIVPWKELTEAIEPFYPKPQGAGLRAVGVERMLRIHFRHLMSRRNLGNQLFHLVNQYQEKGLKVNRGTIVDVSIIHAPSSTKNKKKQRDPELHQIRKGNQ